MNSFGILDFALPFGVLALVLVGWMGIRRLGGRGARARDAQAGKRGESRITRDVEPS